MMLQTMIPLGTLAPLEEKARSFGSKKSYVSFLRRKYQTFMQDSNFHELKVPEDSKQSKDLTQRKGEKKQI